MQVDFDDASKMSAKPSGAPTGAPPICSVAVALTMLPRNLLTIVVPFVWKKLELLCFVTLPWPVHDALTAVGTAVPQFVGFPIESNPQVVSGTVPLALADVNL
jgi:hypothetical protein